MQKRDLGADERAKPGEAAVHLDTTTVRGLAIPDKGSRLWLDDEIPGFGCQVTYGGTKTFRLRYRRGGKWYSLKIGRWHDPGERLRPSRGAAQKSEGISAGDARVKAAELRRQINAGGHPAFEVRAAAAEQQRAERGLVTVRQAWAEYCGTDEAPGFVYQRARPMAPKSILQIQTSFANHVEPRIGGRAMSSIEAEDIEAIALEVGKSRMRKGRKVGGPAAARHVVAHLSAFFAWALKRKLVKANPAKAIDRGEVLEPAPVRERYLAPEEFDAVMRALDEWPLVAKRGSRHGPAKIVRLDEPQVRQLVSCEAFRVGLLTAARKSEVYKMRWSDVDLDTRVWRRPARTMKARKAHEIVLAPTAVNSLRKLRDAHGDPVFAFPGKQRLDALIAGRRLKGDEGGPMKDAHELWGRIRRTIGLDDVTIHDLRHTAASVLISAGYTLDDVGAQLAHANPQTTKRYAHLMHERKREMADAMEAFSNMRKQSAPAG